MFSKYSVEFSKLKLIKLIKIMKEKPQKNKRVICLEVENYKIDEVEYIEVEDIDVEDIPCEQKKVSNGYKK